MFDINFRTNVKEIEKSLNAFAYKQLPKALEGATNSVGKQITVAQVANLRNVLDRPTPFTQKSIGMRPARKQNNYTVIIYIKDIAAEYLLPYEFGGLNKLNSRSLLKPVDSGVNQYGNLPRTKLASLKRRKDIFIGVVKGKNGQQINGVWQRLPKSRKNAGGMRLLIAFTAAHPVKQHLGWRALAATIVKKILNKEIGRALACAIAEANK